MPQLPGLPPPLQLLYLMVLSMPMVVVAAFVSLADTVLYPQYTAAPRLWNLDPLQDQRIAGALMWVPAHLSMVVAFTIVFFRANQEADKDEPDPEEEAQR